jgi:hypothetical protein
MDDARIRYVKECITRDDLPALQEFYAELQDTENVDWQRLFLKAYLHACLKKREAIVQWFMEEYEKFDPISKIALRQSFAYGRWLLAR